MMVSACRYLGFSVLYLNLRSMTSIVEPGHVDTYTSSHARTYSIRDDGDDDGDDDDDDDDVDQVSVMNG